MNFATQLAAAKGDLTARQVAEALSEAVSDSTVEDWLSGQQSPPKWQQKLALAKLADLTGKTPVETWDGCKTNRDVKDYFNSNE